MRRIILALFLVALVPFAQAAEKAPLKVFVSVDMEGIWGIVNSDQTSTDGKDYGAARKWMAEDVNAVLAGLFEAGATEVVVNDSHGGMRNILASDLDSRASLITGSPKQLSMMEGVGPDFAACVLVGYHAMAGTASGVLDHTISGSTVRFVKVNGREMPELGLNAAIAGSFGVPVILLSGDDKVCGQARDILGSGVVTVEVKQGVGRYAAKLLPRDEARARLKNGAREALERRSAARPFVLAPPLSFELGLYNSGQAEYPSWLPGIRRVDARTLGFSASNFLEGFRIVRLLITLAAS